MVKLKPMKRRSTTPLSKGLVTKSALVATAVVMVMAAPLAMMPRVRADKYDDQINALQKEIDQYQTEAGKLSKKIGTLQDEIAGIEREKRVIQGQIDLSQAKYDKLQAQIKETKQRIADNRDALGITIADLYVDDSISPLEMLASSENIGDYVDKQTYRSSISDQLKETIKKINDLKESLEKQKKDTELVLADQKNSRKALAAKEAERSRLLSETKGKESSYKKLANDRHTEQLRIQQQQQEAIEAAIAAAGGGRSGTVLPGTSGGYPWNDSNCYVDGNAWSYGGVDGNGTDGMGYGCRQCVSYVAWRVLKETGYAPINWGNAYDWPSSARGKFTVSTVPRAHSAGVIMSGGSPGHIVWVESINQSAGTMVVSQYNYFNAGGSGWGHYSKMEVPIGTYQQYIYF
jgi:peptidoglycan hydrolase CwlO-like protein/surface antigen